MKYRVHAKPGSRVESVERRSDGVLVVRVKERAADGKANEAIRSILAREFGCKPRDIVIRSGATSRIKTVEVTT